MPRILFTPNLRSHVESPDGEVRGSTVAAVLRDAFQGRDDVRSYVLDDQGRPRKHIAIFINGVPIQDRESLSDRLGDDDEVFITQALSGG